MAKRKSTLIQYGIILILGIAIAALLILITIKTKVNDEISFAPDMTVDDNPLMGYAPDASNIAYCEKANLVYIPITWKEWEPEEGVYNIEGLEKKYNIPEWKEKNKHAVIRFMCDVPGKKDHYDIPKWLLDKVKDGTYYNDEYGKGYSPDYSNEIFMKYHKRAIEKLAEYCNDDYFVSFVELGSIGHWGEWHALGSDGTNLMPDKNICEQYAMLYSESFKNAILLTRRNYDFAVSGQMGVYNDMVGDEEETKEWLGWINQGGIQETSQEELILSKLNLDKTVPVGGEFTSSPSMDTIISEDFGSTLARISESKMTYLGPMVPNLTKEEYTQACDSILRRMGYKIYVSALSIRYNFSKDEMNLNLKFENAGNAGFYFDWPVTVYVFDKDMNQVYWEGLQLDLRDLNTNDEITAECSVPVNSDLMKEFYIGVGITDFEGKDHIRLAIDEDGKDPVFVDNAQIIYHYDKNSK